MEIKKYKYLAGSRYKITLDEKDIILYEDIIVKHQILLKKELSLKEVNNLLKENEYYELYYKALDYIKRKIRTKVEIKKYLLKTSDKNILIDEVIDKIKNEGYLNDIVYARSYIHDEVNFKLVGPLKIKKDLLALGLDEKSITDELKEYKKEIQINKIKNYIEKQTRLNSKKSLSALKEKIMNYLINQGFYRDDILKELQVIKVDEKLLYKKEYDKQYQKLSKKFSGKELEYKIKQKMYTKGFYGN